MLGAKFVEDGSYVGLPITHMSVCTVYMDTFYFFFIRTFL